MVAQKAARAPGVILLAAFIIHYGLMPLSVTKSVLAPLKKNVLSALPEDQIAEF